ncbi:hypothetical protein PMI42_06076 [Bradyrhizobium sp. YR681]|uniref:hypothetical protein n=1 Tax=Bradyrhizobium sp. YR681 TaxID=1144344 RepID=UPI00026F97A3|nr:hypothetical protein [Bradyrhizobium sp. YR681]EJN10589.1 hypothetical protein PMI42_06076 [Bradyrhizobium sp. YR681]
MIADAIYCTIAGFDFYHALARVLISRGLSAGSIMYGRMRQLIDAAEMRRCIDQEDLKVTGAIGRGHTLLKYMTTPM